MQAIDVRFTLNGEDARPPLRTYAQDAGTDLPCSEEMVCPPRKAINLPTGVSLELPSGYWALVTGRSSANSVHGLIVIQGVIDNGYRGELFVRVYNPGDKPFTILKHMRLAQVILFPLVVPRFIQTPTLGPGERGDKGFGSTGQ